MTIYLLNGTVHEHPHCTTLVLNGCLVIHRQYSGSGFGGEWVASYPLTSVQRWEPEP